MLRLKSLVEITQQPTKDFPDRNKSKKFIFDFLHEVQIVSGWQIMTDTAKLTIPKKLYFKDEEGNRVNFDGKAIIGNNSQFPILLRGDKIKISLGYVYNVNLGAINEQIETEEINTIFDGYISKITNRIPLEIECEDRMWQLKQIKVPNKVFSDKTYSVQKMIAEMLDAQPETRDITLVTGTAIGQKIETNIGDEFRTQDDTIGSVLNRLQKDAHLHSYFRNVQNADGNFRSELRCSGLVYFPSDRRNANFVFQKNIISDQLEYKRKEDIKMGVRAYSINKIELNTVNSKGTVKTKHERLETFVGEKDGELRTPYFWNIQSEKELKILAERYLRKCYYTGFFGGFTTFGLPKVKHGDQVTIQDEILPERDGSYLVKAVTTTFGTSGFRQDISLHLKLGPWTNEEVKNNLNITEVEINNGL